MTGFIWRDPSGQEFVIECDGDEADAGEKKRRKPQRDGLLSLLGDVELWHDANCDAFATFPIAGHREHRPVRSREFRQWLSLLFLDAKGSTLGGQALEDAIRLIEARASQGREYQTWRRVGQVDDKLFLDLCDGAWRAVEVSASGWRVVADPNVKFLRTPAMRALPEPEAGECIEMLRGFLNLGTDDDFTLVVAWLVAALRVGVPFPILVISGQQGSGKTVAARLLRMLLDPNDAPSRAVPKDDRDLLVAAVNTHVLSFDNLSGVAAWFSDAVCRLATGAGYSTRRLHTDSDEQVFSAAKPCMLNGIPNLTDRADLGDRAVAIHLPTIDEATRRPEMSFWQAFEEARPYILGALLDAVVSALKCLPTIKPGRFLRMADFCQWSIAAEPGLGWEPGTFMAAFERNRKLIFEEAAEANPLALLIRDRWDQLRQSRECSEPDAWEGRPTDLLEDLNALASEGVRKSKFWPATPSALGAAVKRIAPALRPFGFIIESYHSGSRTIRIVKPR